MDGEARVVQHGGCLCAGEQYVCINTAMLEEKALAVELLFEYACVYACVCVCVSVCVCVCVCVCALLALARPLSHPRPGAFRTCCLLGARPLPYDPDPPLRPDPAHRRYATALGVVFLPYLQVAPYIRVSL